MRGLVERALLNDVWIDHTIIFTVLSLTYRNLGLRISCF